MSVSLHILFGPGERTSVGYRCECCGEVLLDIEQFAGPKCWPCSDGSNPMCPTCVDRGTVSVNYFRRPNAVSHRMTGRDEWGDVHTACGRTIPWANCGGALLSPCKRCWP